ncbi:TraM recognition domain-containing protein [Pseudomonas alabamensis]|uniref:TraM recognition domain-containing protein n=1 Tax=Pseudomonas alabamensis TaxID=3064349 RepID=UPI0011A45E5C
MELLRLILLNTNPTLTAVFALLIGILLVLSVTGAVRETDETTALEVFLVWLRRAIIIMLLVSLPMFVCGLYVYAYFVYGYDWGMADRYMGLFGHELKEAISGLWWSLLVVMTMPVFVRWVTLRWVRPAISSWLRRFRVKQSGDALSDIRVDMENAKAKDFNPRDFYKDGFFFLGLDGAGAPIYMTDEEFRKNHKKVIGPSQTGKGVALGVLLDQAIKKGWGAWFVDQKPDDFICDIMRESCEENGREAPEILDLNGVGPGSYAPFIFGTRRERRERVVKAFGMADTGSTADFYKKNERAVLDYLMPLWDGSLGHLEKLVRGKHPEIDDVRRQWIRNNVGGIESNLSEFMQLDTLRATEGESFNVSNALERASVVYVRAHMKDTIVRKACVSLLDEIIQVALRKPLPGPIFMVLDECRFIVSDSLADGLATVLSKGINMALAYQSINDLLNLPDKSLNADSIKTGIETNTQVMLSYRAVDFDTAEWVSNQTGYAQKTVSKMEKVEINKGGAEEWGTERSVGQQEENTITTNQMLSFPPRVCALVRPNKLATVLYTCWINVKEIKGMPPRHAVAPSLVLPAQRTAQMQNDDEVIVEDDPFAATAAQQDESDPFAQVDTAEAEPDPFDSVEIEGDDDDPTIAAASKEYDDDFSSIDEVERDEEPEPAKPIAAKQGAISPEQQAAIDKALSGILASPTNQSKKAGAEPRTKTVDLSAIDKIEGI